MTSTLRPGGRPEGDSRRRSTARAVKSAEMSEAAVRKHVGSIFAKLDLGDDTDRRVAAVLTYLRG